MAWETISATDLRTRTREIMQRARFKHETFLVENFGDPMIVILGVEEYALLAGKDKLVPRSKLEGQSPVSNTVNNLS